jgi:hypothetical protein
LSDDDIHTKKINGKKKQRQVGVFSHLKAT